MEILGAGSAVVTIAVEFAHISRRLRRCIRSLTYARRDIKVIHDEVEAFSTLLGLFHSTVTDDRLADEGLSTKIKTSKMTQHIVISGRAALDKIKQILLEVDPLRTDKGYPAHKRWIARWKWSGRKEEWIPVQIELNSIKLSADLLISIVFCQHLVHKLDQLRAEQKNIPNELLQQLSVAQPH
ncbi:uncharacterized protein A1O5_10509 [Cladophialophora psammophila CBS 110553]|uniref:Fungal N-terminal domain-containing protein n=1 Tax=Cladophialophora psammophila CBS 110553 TaxID=1182543 RepID=W9WE50_9EURO|nr:uncharacterized protein A1O5_10509 [Cladophialophora psammophila CBS 110553]EXJ66357.1 hypothetical protein A1O5_10509 [Cladophialophora psammophila CBS 110553]